MAIDAVQPIEPGDTAVETITWNAQAGSHLIKVVADLSNEVTESNETNNIQTYTFSIMAPDFIVAEITWLPESPSNDETITFNVTVKNQGSGRSDNSRVYLYIDDSSRGYQEFERLDAGAMVTKSFTWTARVGSHIIKAIVDEDGFIQENDETNNEKTVVFSTVPPDLIVESINTLGLVGSPSVGDIVAFNVFIKNQGTGRSGYTYVHFYRDKYSLDSARFNPIDPGATANYTFTWRVRAGPHVIKAIVDKDDWVVESDETNNERTVVFSILPIDLTIASITASPENPSIGDQVTFDVSIKNQGSGEVSGPRVYFYIDGAYESYQDVAEIKAGATATKTFTLVARARTHTAKAIVDRDDQIIESDETNNEKTIIVSTILPDLVIKQITSSLVSPSTGDRVVFTVTIENHGTGKSDSFRVAYYIENNLLTSDNIDRMEPGSTVNKTFTWTASAGSHNIKAFADYEHKIAESNETNNEKILTISTIAPDLMIEKITSSPASPAIGETVTFSVAIKNQGSGKAINSRIDFYVDDSPSGYQDIPEINAGATVTKTFSWTVQAGSHAIRAVIDKDGLIIESDENNNEKRTTFSALVTSVTPPASKPTPEPTPGTKQKETPAEKSAPVDSTGKLIAPELWFVLAGIVAVGMLVAVLLMYRQR